MYSLMCCIQLSIRDTTVGRTENGGTTLRFNVKIRVIFLVWYKPHNSTLRRV